LLIRFILICCSPWAIHRDGSLLIREHKCICAKSKGDKIQYKIRAHYYINISFSLINFVWPVTFLYCRTVPRYVLSHSFSVIIFVRAVSFLYGQTVSRLVLVKKLKTRYLAHVGFEPGVVARKRSGLPLR
jgi:hypothetical protein